MNQEIPFKSDKAENFTRTLIGSGHAQAASSFSAMVGQEVIHTDPFIWVSSNPLDEPEIIKGDDQLTLIITEIMGELKGKSYLILNDKECDQIHKRCLGEDYWVKKEWLGKELLKELDNILSGAVITEFSNRLDLHIYSDVPQVCTMPPGDIQNLIRDDLNEDFVSDFFIATDMRFFLGGNEIYQPQWIWKLAEPFFFLVHQHAKSEFESYE